MNLFLAVKQVGRWLMNSICFIVFFMSYRKNLKLSLRKKLRFLYTSVHLQNLGKIHVIYGHSIQLDMYNNLFPEITY